MAERELKRYHCSFEVTLEIIGGKWKSLIIWHLLSRGTLRNGEMLRVIPSITQKMLTQQLRELERSGLVVRHIYEQIPPRVDYTLTEIGQSLKPLMELMKAWGAEYAKRDALYSVKACQTDPHGEESE